MNADLRGKATISYVAESVTRPYIGDSDYIHSQAKHQCIVGNQEFSIKGSYFAEKDRFTSSCAHSSLVTAIENMPDIARKSLSYLEINDLLKLDHITRNPADGLLPQEINKLLEQVNLAPVLFDFDKAPKHISYQQAIYYAMESNWPVILVFPLQDGIPGHAVTIVGHQFDSDAWLPEVEDSYFKLDSLMYLRSVAWTNSFKIQDDNFGPYYNFSSDYFAKTKPTVIAVAPKKLAMYGHVAELFGYAEFLKILTAPENKVIFPSNAWANIARDHILKGKIILRTQYISRQKYLSHLKKRGHFNNRTVLDSIRKNLPAAFWLVEMSIPELFTANQSKIGEIAVDPNSKYPNTVKSVWLSGTYYLANSNQYLQVSDESHYPLT